MQYTSISALYEEKKDPIKPKVSKLSHKQADAIFVKSDQQVEYFFNYVEDPSDIISFEYGTHSISFCFVLHIYEFILDVKLWSAKLDARLVKTL